VISHPAKDPNHHIRKHIKNTETITNNPNSKNIDVGTWSSPEPNYFKNRSPGEEARRAIQESSPREQTRMHVYMHAYPYLKQLKPLGVVDIF
jgi:hypothetical protein